MVALNNIKRHKTHSVTISNVTMGSAHPIRVQSMTDTDTADIERTTQQIIDLVNAGSELVRLTINTNEAAKAIPYIYEKLDAKNYSHIPLIGDFHYNGHTLLTNNPESAKLLAKYRINPGNVGFGEKHDKQFAQIVEIAIANNKPVRIGVNWGSVDEEVVAKLMDDNNHSSTPRDSDSILREALIISALTSAEHAEKLGLSPDKIVISCKTSKVQDLVSVYQELAKHCNYALHLGLTEAGMGSKGIVASSAALGILLQQGIGDTIRVSITPEPGASRTKEVHVAQEILQTMGLRSFSPQVSSCPGCGRTTSAFFRELANDIQHYIKEEMPTWRTKYPGVEELNIAVMGCIVNGPGESRHADIGISLPGSGENPVAPVFIDGQKQHTLRGDSIANDFKNILISYIEKRFG